MFYFLKSLFTGNSNYLTNYSNILEYIPKTQEKIIYHNIINNNDLVEGIKNFCIKNSLNCKGSKKKVLISLSGGVDSMVLTTILVYLGYEVICIHINYNNREETSLEQNFLQEWCNYNNIKLYVKVITDIKRCNTNRSKYEFESKKIRFNFYKDIMDKESLDFILLGHHKDDIVENIFTNVCRGRNILDLAVICEESIINDVKIMRPLIDFYKTTIYEFANDYQVPYFKDTTPKWSVRGKYRNEIYPALEYTFLSKVKSNLLEISKQSYEWNELVLDKIIDPYVKTIIFNNNNCVFNVENYNKYPLSFWNVVFMKIFYYYGKSCPSKKAINVFINCIQTKNVNYISLSNLCICKNKNYQITIEFCL